MKIDVWELSAADAEAWEGFLRTTQRSDVYSTPAFRSFLQSSVGGRAVYFGAFRDGRMVGLLPVFVANGPVGRVVNSLPWFGTYGGCLVGLGEEKARVALLEAYRRLLDAEATAFATMIVHRDEMPWLQTYESVLAPRLGEDRVCQLSWLPVDNPDPSTAILSGMRQKHRNQLRKGLKQGFGVRRVDADEDWSYLRRSHEAHMRAIGGRAKSRADFEALRAHLPADCRELWIATDGEMRIAAMLLLVHGETVEYLIPTVSAEHRSRQPLSALIHAAMVHHAQAGRRNWNWGGTWESQKSLHHFKAGWGAKDARYRYLIHASEAALAMLRDKPGAVAEAFRGYYLYPFAAL